MSKLFIISNRLPLSIDHQGETYSCRQSSGGLVSAINAYLSQTDGTQFIHKIWAGVSEYPEKIWAAATSAAGADYDFQPVFLPTKLYEQYYNGFANSVIWPLFHYFPSFADYQPAFYEAYRKVNERFAAELEKKVDNGDTVWIHDYHLLPLAGLLRKTFPNLTIGFFLHIPFPTYELFRLIPRQWQQELLQGLLGADVIGFHTDGYAQHFMDCAKRILQASKTGGVLHWQDREVLVRSIPIGIDYNQFQTAASDMQVLSNQAEYLRSKQDKKLIFSVDRLDYTKGVYGRLKGYREFLIQNPAYRGRVVFALVIVPSRDSISKYAERKKMIDEYIGNFNSRFGNISWQPVIYQYGHLSFEELVGMYTACDLALITPVRDGMNLVAKEFVASRRDRQGVLVLSEMAGAAEELTEALLINPNDRQEIAEMIRKGLEMRPAEQQDRMVAMQAKLQASDVANWGRLFFEALDTARSRHQCVLPEVLDNFAKAKLLRRYKQADRRLFLLDYDGTLAPFCADPQDAVPCNEVLEVLAELCADPANDIYIVSGRDSDTLDTWLGHLPVGLIAEHGLKLRGADKAWHVRSALPYKAALNRSEKIMQQFTDTCPGSFIELKDASVAWHYRKADLAIAEIKAGQLCHALQQNADIGGLNILKGHKVIEAKDACVNKGEAIAELISKQQYDFILCAGDDQTDEDMFRHLRGVKGAFTIKVGHEASFADYHVLTPYLVQELLERIVTASEAVKQIEV